MHKLIIDRAYKKDFTIGLVEVEGFRCFSLELPWKNNGQNVSCIPPGVYDCKKIVSPSLGECFEIQNVRARTYIRAHKGNFTYQIKGCVLFGDSLKYIDGDSIVDVANSSATFDKLMSLLPDEFVLEIGLPNTQD